MEACIENSTKSLLFLDHVRFDPQPPMTVSVLEVESNDKDEADGPLRWTAHQVIQKSSLFMCCCFSMDTKLLLDTECLRRVFDVVK